MPSGGRKSGKIGFVRVVLPELLLVVSSNHWFSGFLVLQVWGKLRVRESQGELRRCNNLKTLKLVTIYKAVSHSFFSCDLHSTLVR